METDASGIRNPLSALRAAYQEALPGKVRALRDTWTRARPDSRNPGLWRAMFLSAHRLAGSGAIFGFPGVTRLARDLEDLVHPLLSIMPTPLGETADAIEDLLVRIEKSAMEGPEPESPTPSPLVRPATVRATEDQLLFLVEDDPSQAGEIADQLGHFGYSVQVFLEPHVAEEALRGARPVAILVDVVLSGGDVQGPAWISRMRASGEATPPILFCSARDDFEARLEAIRAGGDGYFSKPLDIASVVDTIESLARPSVREPYRVLIVDDDPFIAGHHALSLQMAGMRVRVETEPSCVLGALVETESDLVLIDLYMPSCSGQELAAVLRQQPKYLGLPIVFLSTERDRDLQLGALAMGADDFLSIPIREHHLVAAISARVERTRALRAQLTRDGLTGLLNHSSFKDRIVHEVGRSEREGGRLAMAMIDIDWFKGVNDTFGHSTGDRVLGTLAHVLKRGTRQTDILARYGGEEFGVILPDTEGAGAARVVDEVRVAFAQVRHSGPRGGFHTTFSAGVAAFPSCPDARTLMEAADAALYDAKRAGRDRVVLRDG